MTALKLTILGCGASGGVPRVGNNWGACDPENPRNRRLRCSALIERYSARGRTTVLIDTSPDLRQQLLAAKVAKIDGVLFTHDHADHTHGIDDLRVLAYAGKRRINVYFDAATGDSLTTRFRYCFSSEPNRGYPPILKANRFRPLESLTIDGAGGPITVLPFEQRHGPIISIGFRVGGLAYSSDISGVPEHSEQALAGLDCWVLDALRYNTHVSHYSLAEALGEVARVGAKRAILTHLHDDLDYETLRGELPDHVAPAYDGMTLEFEADPTEKIPAGNR